MLKVRDYKCTHCGFEWETFTKNDHHPNCPRCDSTEVEPQLSAASFKVGGVGGYDRRMKV